MSKIQIGVMKSLHIQVKSMSYTKLNLRMNRNLKSSSNNMLCKYKNEESFLLKKSKKTTPPRLISKESKNSKKLLKKSSLSLEKVLNSKRGIKMEMKT